MQELEKILEEIDQEKKNAALSIRHTTGYKAGQIRMAERIEEIIRKHMNDGWIPVEERMPEDEEMVLVTCQTKAGRKSVNRAWYGEGFWHGTGYWMMKKYEDTGLTPDEINALRERDTAKEPEVHTNSDEIRVGSLVIGKGVKVYSCPKCGNMIGKSDNFCPECGQRLKLATAAQWPEWKDRMLHAFLGGHV